MRPLARVVALVLVLLVGVAAAGCGTTPLQVNEEIVAGNQDEQRAMDRHEAAQSAAAAMFLLLFLVLPLTVIALALALAVAGRNQG